MNGYRIVWEDEANAREIELFVDYTAIAGAVQIDAIHPTKVTFYNAETKTADRSIGVHTHAGRNLLSAAYLASRPLQPTLEVEILNQLAQRDEAFEPQVAC